MLALGPGTFPGGYRLPWPGLPWARQSNHPLTGSNWELASRRPGRYSLASSYTPASDLSRPHVGEEESLSLKVCNLLKEWHMLVCNQAFLRWGKQISEIEVLKGITTCLFCYLCSATRHQIILLLNSYSEPLARPQTIH